MPIEQADKALPLVSASVKGKPKSFADVIGEAPTTSVEYKLYKGMSAAITTKQIEDSINYYQTHKGRHFKAEYKRLAIAYLQEELGKRRRENQQQEQAG